MIMPVRAVRSPSVTKHGGRGGLFCREQGVEVGRDGGDLLADRRCRHRIGSRLC